MHKQRVNSFVPILHCVKHHTFEWKNCQYLSTFVNICYESDFFNKKGIVQVKFNNFHVIEFDKDKFISSYLVIYPVS